MGSYTAQSEEFDCGEAHAYGVPCPRRHQVTLTYHRSSDKATLRFDGMSSNGTDFSDLSLAMGRATLLELHDVLANVLEHGGVL